MLKNLLKNPLTYFDRDEVYEKAHDHFLRNERDDALATLDDLFKKQDDHLAGYLLAAQIHEKLHHDEQALQYFTKVLALESDHDEARTGSAHALHELGRHEEALLEYQILLERHPLTVDWYLAVGVSYAKLELHRMAARYMDRALKLFPQYIQVHTTYAYELYTTWSFKLAYDHIQQAKELYYKRKSNYGQALLDEIEQLETKIKQSMQEK
jgi:tetratricopeptide (TPR) repeat protein